MMKPITNTLLSGMIATLVVVSAASLFAQTNSCGQGDQDQQVPFNKIRILEF